MSATEWSIEVISREGSAQRQGLPSFGDVKLQAAPKIAGHGLAAAVFFFCLQRFALGESFETSLIWAITGGGGAALLAWLQYRRGV